MRFTHVDHIGIAVENLEEGIATYTLLFGCGPSRRVTVISEQVEVAFFNVGPTRIELLAATDSTSPVAKFCAKRGPGIHHIAFAVPDLATAVSALKADGMTPTTDGVRYGAGRHKIAFLHPKQTGGVLIELVEK
ncbi:MAG: methylmalonyl-CoA epimerase [Deltaproteobacteria bacterium]|nr:methylmalonyl-CoA epimerase [Deltaproteobacteria bacterium]